MINFKFENNILHLENDYIERNIFFKDSVPYKSEIKNKKSGYTWAGLDSDVIKIPGIDLKDSEIDTFGYSLIFKTKCGVEVKWIFKLSDSHRFFETQIGIKGKPIEVSFFDDDKGASGIEGKKISCEKEVIDSFGAMSKNVDVKITEFFDNTDFTDNVMSETQTHLYYLWANTEYSGQIMVLKEKQLGECMVVVKNAPTAIGHLSRRFKDFAPEPIENMHVLGSGIDLSMINEDDYTYSYSVALTLCSPSEEDDLIKFYYNEALEQDTPYIISNTWGGGNRDKRVCESFILKEIDTAGDLGVDVVQIDDGWQLGKSANSAFSNGDAPWESGYRKCNPDFWKVDENKFPSGLKFLVDYAWDKNVELGLWFSPDGENDYEAWQQDADTIYELFKEYNIRYFKLDGINIKSQKAHKNITNMLNDLLRRSYSRIKFNMDITAGKRFGYFVNREIGQLFVENRYTFIGNYRPHATLRNLWMLSRLIPSRRFLFEVTNNALGTEKYDENDVTAPRNYDIDYMFASVMVSNPLMWLELSNLDKNQKERLKTIISVYKKYRNDFGTVTPIYNKPDGFSLTGFKIEGYSNNYVILFRENCEESKFDIELKEILATNDEKAKTGKAEIHKKLGYIFAII